MPNPPPPRSPATVTRTRAARVLAVLAVPLIVLVFALAQDASAVGDAPASALPVSEAQVERGAEQFATHCATCHGPDLEGSAHFPPLVGTPFQRRWVDRTLGELYTYVHEQMPLGAGGSLEAATYTDLVAYVLSRNGVTPGETAFDPENDQQLALPLTEAGWDVAPDE
jgi:mono/diheme cytochrome c family protein